MQLGKFDKASGVTGLVDVGINRKAVLRVSDCEADGLVFLYSNGCTQLQKSTGGPG